MSILRSSKFVKYFVSFARSFTINQSRGVDGSLLRESKSLINSSRSFCATPITQNTVKANSIDRSIQRLDQDVRRSGRISSKELQEVFDEIRQFNHATSTQSLMIIRCCGNLVPDATPEARTKLVSEVWDTFEKMGVQFDISHYNALLRVYLENEHNFSPITFLSTLENKGVEPNRVTFQRLVAAYCQKGDIEGATHILEFMKDKQIPVNENVFNSLILGHSQSNDMESAVGILTVMKQANLPPTTETYNALLCGYARHGDIDSVLRVIQESNSEGIEFIGKDILEVIYTMIVNNHGEHLDKMLNHLKSYSSFNHDAKNVILRLITRGEDKSALSILKILPEQIVAEGQTPASGSFIVNHMVKTMRPAENIIEMCHELKLLGNQKALSVAVEASLKQNYPENSLKLLTALSKEEEVCHHYYWPVLVQFGKAGNTQGILKTLRQSINEVGQPPLSETLKDYVIPYLSKGDQAIQDLRLGGISVASAAAAMVGYLLSINNLKQAKTIALQYHANYNAVHLRKAVVNAFLATKDVESLVTMVQVMEESDSEEVEAGGRVLLDIVHLLRQDRVKVLEEILNKYLETGVGVSNEVAELIQNKLSGEELTQEISSLLLKLTSNDLTLLEIKRPKFKKLPWVDIKDESILLHSIENAETRGDSVKGYQRQLLILYYQNKEMDKAKKLKQEMLQQGFEFQIGMLAILLDIAISNDLLEEALDCYKLIQEKHLDQELDVTKIVKLAGLLCKNNKFADAVELLKANKRSDEITTEKGFAYISNCWKLLNSLAEQHESEKLKEIFNVMVENKFIEPTNVLLGPLIKVHLLKDDLENALIVFEECCTKYRATPWKNELACKLIDKEDANALQRLTDLSTQIHGEVNSLYDLVLSFVECGRTRQARKILETPGLRTRSQRINSACERYLSEGRVNHLERLVEVTKDMTHINRSDIYFHLLNSYCKANDVEKALGLWTQMQDEDVQPSDSFLINLGNLLKTHNRPIPFQMPENEEIPNGEVIAKTEVIAPSALKALRKSVYGKELDEAITILKTQLKMEDLTNADRSRVLNLMFNSGRVGEGMKLLLEWLEKGLKPNIKTFNIAINSAAKIGDLDSLISIEKLIDDDLKKMTSFINRKTHCMVEAGRAEDVLSDLTKAIQEATLPEQLEKIENLYPRGGIFSVLNDSTEILEKFKELEKIYRSKGLYLATNTLWIHSTIAGDKETAESSWNNLSNHQNIMFRPILKSARSTNNLQMIDELLNKFIKSGASRTAIALIYSCKMDILLNLNEDDNCEKVLLEAVKVCALEDINESVLKKLKRHMEMSGKQFQFTIPSKVRKAQSSSSSSSDSDNEDNKK